MKVLSLFDGMSCGQIALNELGIIPEMYLAAEIKPHAIKVTQNNFPNTVQLGDVRQIEFDNGEIVCQNGKFNVGNIDLFIGGSPCQDLSALRRNREGLKGKKSSLFYEWLRLKEQVKPRFFLLENVATMKDDDKQIIDDLFFSFRTIEKTLLLD